MFAYLLRRLLGLTLVLVAMTLSVFFLQNVLPSDPARSLAGPMAPLSRVEELRQELGLNDSIATQYGRFLARLVHGDLGTSIRTRQPVIADIRERLPASLELSGAAFAFGLGFATLAGILPLIFKNARPLQYLLTVAASIPIFATALLLAYTFWFQLGWLPGSGRMGDRYFSGPTGLNILDGLLKGEPAASFDALAHILLPALALALPIAIAVGRTMSSSLVDVMRQPYIGTARGKGLSESRVVLRHAVRNSSPVVLAMIALQFRLLFGNLLVVELVFGWPGLGFYMVQSLATADSPAVLGVTIVLGIFYLAVSLLTEVLQTWADPRIEL
ncbi:ABC transporter permease [Rhizobium sp. Root1204]|uniref:ABC transporter permease n=1 Tax=Rhizobium sp. Root1204 TaxID=1736428 RepID=UPI00071579AB|nr:ABC transporter permease [Rhizobium sp. Root1204]KQV36359.1 peptide ABC transporter permease [Rhizobium sp. Root1204]